MELIDKSKVVVEIERMLKKEYPCDNSEQETGYSCALYELQDFLDTLEVKEVDFDNDLVEEVYSHLDGIKDTADRMTSGNFMHHRAAIKFSANVIEKVLGLIGLKAQKGGKV